MRSFRPLEVSNLTWRGYYELAGKFTSHNQLAWQSAAVIYIVGSHFIHQALHPHVHVHVIITANSLLKLYLQKTLCWVYLNLMH